MKRKNNYIFIILILLLGIGFSYLSTTLSINGRGLFGKSNWKIYFDNIREIEGLEFVTTSPETIDDTTTSINFEVNLPRPGDTYKFYIDVVNDGDIDAMINVITSNNINSDYADYKITYYNGLELSDHDLLKANDYNVLVVEISYKTDIDLTTLTSDKDPIYVTINLEYVQADKTARIPEKEILNTFETDTWETIITNVQNNKTYKVGDTKEVNLGPTYGTHTLRVVNNTTPNICSRENFSQTACGLVLEFTDIIATRTMNDTSTSLGGWETSNMRSFLNDINNNLSIINTLNNILDINKIKNTYTITGHDSTSTDNHITYDKLYLLSPHEVWEDGTSNIVSVRDSAFNNTRQLDYYKNYKFDEDTIGVTTNNYSALVKYKNTLQYSWWLRTSDLQYTNYFMGVSNLGHWDNSLSDTVRGVSPAFRLG